MWEVSDLVRSAHSACPPTARRESRHYRYLTATSITQGGLHESHTETRRLGAKRAQRDLRLLRGEPQIRSPQSGTHQDRSSFVARDWPAEMEKCVVFFPLPLSLFCLLWRLFEVLHDMLEAYSFSAFQTDWGDIQKDVLQILVEVIFHLLWQLHSD